MDDRTNRILKKVNSKNRKIPSKQHILKDKIECSLKNEQYLGNVNYQRNRDMVESVIANYQRNWDMVESVIANYQRNWDAIQGFIANYQRNWDAIQGFIANYQRNYDDILKKYALIFKQVEAFAINFENIQNSLFNVSKIVEGVYLDINSFENEIDWLNHIPKEYKLEYGGILRNNGPDAFWEGIYELTHEESFLTNLKSKICTLEIMDERKEIIDIILANHKCKNYIISIPLLLSNIEGIIWTIGVKLKKVEDKPNSKIKLDKNGEILVSNNNKVQYYVAVTDLFTEFFTENNKLASYFNSEVYVHNVRHGILHGRIPGYYKNEKLASQLILLLLELANTSETLLENVENLKNSIDEHYA